MKLMLLFLRSHDDLDATASDRAEIQRLAEELTQRGTLRRAIALNPAWHGVRVRVRPGDSLVTDTPFTESKEVVAGIWVVDVASREEAIAIARRCPDARRGRVEVHTVGARYTYDDSGDGTPFLLSFHMEPGLSDPDGAKLREMIEFGEMLARERTLVETAPLSDEPRPARVKSRGGQTFVTDGPFAEVKEAIGGYSLVRVAGRADAIELAKRYPHAGWGPVYVREVAFVDPV